MPFTPRNWIDGSAPAVSAANIEDLETRVTDYADTRFGVEAGIYNVKDYGAVGDGSTDDTAAIQDAIDAAAVAGGTVGAVTNYGATVWFPKGNYICNSALDLDQLVNVTLQGAGSGWGSGYGIGAPSRMIFTQTGTGTLLPCRSSAGITVRNIGIHYSSTTFTGKMFDFEWYGAGPDSGGMLFENVHLGGAYHSGGTAIKGATSCIELSHAILGTFRNVRFSWCQYGVRGGVTAYSNAHYFDNCQWEKCEQSAIYNSGEGWTVVSPYVEAGSLGSPAIGGMKYFYYEGAENTGFADLTVLGGWISDISGDWVAPYYMTGLGGGVCRLTVLGGLCSDGSSGGVVGARPYYGVGNTMEFIGKQYSGGFQAGGYLDSTSLGNGPFMMFGYEGGLQQSVARMGGNHHLELTTNHFEATGNEPTVTVQAAAGTGATAVCRTSDSDSTGTITVTTGTGTTAGALAKIEFNRAFGQGNYIRSSKVMLSPHNAAAAALQGHRTLGGGAINDYDGWYLEVVNDPAESTAFSWDYLVVA